LDTATQNPDSTNYQCPPDGVTGPSTVARQKLATTIANGGSDQYDWWVVQWDHEPTVANSCRGQWMASNDVENGAGYNAGDLINCDAANSNQWASGGYATSLITGGLCIYKMAPNTSPFPAEDGSGPFAPISTTQLIYGTDVLHDNLRVVGSNYEIIDTTNALNQQGNCFQGAWDANQEVIDSYNLTNTVNTGSSDNQGFQVLFCRTAFCPPGVTDDLTKLSLNRVASAKEGTFVMNRLDMLNNKPCSNAGITAVYSSINNHPALAQHRCFLVMTNTQGWANSSGWNPSANRTQVSSIYKTAVQMNCTVLTGLSTSYTATVSREVTVQCFVSPGSVYLPYAKARHVPVDYNILAGLQNVMDNLPVFEPSKANKTGKFASLAKGLWKKVAPIVKPVAGIVGEALIGKAPESVKQVFGGAEQLLNQVNQRFAEQSKTPLINYDMAQFIQNRMKGGPAFQQAPPGYSLSEKPKKKKKAKKAAKKQ
jgi:hypothetical protein